MVLSAFLKLDGGAFTTGIGKALEGTKFLTRSLGELSAKIKTGFDFGSDMANLSTQLGISAGRATVLRQVFDDTGVGAGALGQTFTIMQKALGGMNDEGEPTNKMFQRLGLSMDGLKKMDAEGQFFAIGKAIKGIEDPGERVTALMGIFGKSGAPLARLFADDGALQEAEARLGGLPAIMDKNANAFNNVSTRLNALKMKTTGFWAGMAEGVLPMADSISRALDGIDLSGIGQRVGTAVSSFVQMFRDAPFGEVMWTGVKAIGEQVCQWVGSAFTAIGNWIGESWGGAVEGVGGMFSGLFDFIAEAFPQVFDAAWTAFKVAAGEAFNWAVTGVMMIGEWLSGALVEAWEWCGKKFDQVWEWITGSLGGAGGTLKDAFFGAVEYLWDSLKLTGSILWDSIKIALGKIANAIGWIFGKEFFDLSDLESGLVDKLENSLAGRVTSSVANTLGDWAGKVAEGYAETGKATIFDMSNDKAALGGKLADYYKNMGDKLSGAGDGAGTGKFLEMFGLAQSTVEGQQNALADGANNPWQNPWGGDGLDPSGKKGGKGGGGADILTDSLARIGGMTGGVVTNNRKMETLAERTAKATEELMRIMKNSGGAAPAAVYA